MMPPPETVGAIHFIGIGGIGMSGIAEMLATRGYKVQGSDAAEGYTWDAIKLGVAFMIVIGSLVAVFPQQVLHVWTKDAAVIHAATPILRICGAGVHAQRCQASGRGTSTKRSVGQRAPSWAMARCGVSPSVKNP